MEGYDGRVVQVSVPTKFLRNWLQSHYSDRLLACCGTELSGANRLEFRVRQPHLAAVEKLRPRLSRERRLAPTAAARPRLRYRFASCPSPRGMEEPALTDLKARRSTRAIRSTPLSSAPQTGLPTRRPCRSPKARPISRLRYNPLYIHARVGMGKTHLLHAIAWEVKSRNPAAKVLYLTAERFMYSFADALQTRDAPAFKEKLRTIDLLLIDDMEFLQGKTFQQEFCHTLNSLIDGGKQVVVAADCAPLLLESFDARMRSRLSGGLVAELAPLDYDLRLKILEKRAAEKIAVSPGFEVPADVLDYLATQLTENGRELEGAITRLHAAYQLTGEKVTCDAAENTIGDLIRSKEPKRVKIDDILRIVAKHYGVQRGDLLSSRRNQSIVRPRQIGMYLAKTLTSRSLPEIGRRFGGRDHTTVLHAIRKIEGLKQQDGALKEELDSLSRMLKDGAI